MPAVGSHTVWARSRPGKGRNSECEVTEVDIKSQPDRITLQKTIILKLNAQGIDDYGG